MTGESQSKSDCSIHSWKENETATTSKDPTQESHNMNDFLLEMNSADEVRQAMKAAIYGKLPQQDQSIQMQVDLHSAITSPVTFQEPLNSRNILQDSRKTGCTRSRNRGRPPKAGPSKSLKSTRSQYHRIYSGKLSNLVHFTKPARRYCDDSDVESLHYVYHR